MTARDIEVCLAGDLFAFLRGWTVVPNVQDYRVHGPSYAELDLVAVSPAGWASEVEIKVTRSDLRRDLEKGHAHDNPRMRFLWFAMPESVEYQDLVPERAGVILVRERNPGAYLTAYKVRRPQVNPTAVKWTDAERYDLARLGLIRYWSARMRGTLTEHLDTARGEAVEDDVEAGE